MSKQIDIVSRQLLEKRAALVAERKKRAAALGSAVYERARNGQTDRCGFEDLYDGIARLDEALDEVGSELRDAETWRIAETVGADVLVCPICGAVALATDGFCGRCGMPLDPGSSSVTERPDDMPEPEGSTRSARCPHCGAPLEPGSEFCAQCGGVLSRQTASSNQERRGTSHADTCR